MNLIEFKNLHTSFYTDNGVVHAVNGVNFSIPEGSTLAVVGESGSGKSVTALSLMGLLPRPIGRIDEGEILYQGKNILDMDPVERRKLRSRDLAMIFQEPMTSLNPALKVGFQIEEVYRRIMGLSKEEAKKKTIEMLEMVEIEDAANKAKSYPHELSGGQRQRVMIAIALASSPKLLIADEPTTALDVTIQKEVLELMDDLKRDLNTSIMLITHDLGVVAQMADDVVVMYGGRVMEKSDVCTIFDNPMHPYTKGLLRARPTLENRGEKLYNIPGNVPPPSEMEGHCPFYSRCESRMDRCKEEVPKLRAQYPGHCVACFLYEGESCE
ncbi:Oligopeptide transport ATP-binding protein OppD [Aedoeadaptatus nemausensis]|uniref:Oligopeptide transport ATP-binding protein OppD n=1 Tax=Aedoeadaptatus nemausensis TaxID=2582829 RepID=A0A6V6Y623_9FIRM|nr:ABC transporter ATP-binding protein [Peptoniphilus nemausensis]CAC9934055.1 Oligopeptide transport ATP-binding protein OppD [Peptoniphilus nemausensis]